MSDHNQLWMDCELNVKAILDALDELIVIASRNEEGYRLVQKQLSDLRKSSDITHDLIAHLLKKPQPKPVLRVVS